MQPHLSRRHLLGGSAALLSASALLSACGQRSPLGDPIPVSIWDLFSGADGANMRSMIAEVAASTGITADPTTLAWGDPYYTKLAMASSSKSPPDTAIMHASRVPGYAPGGLLTAWDESLLAEVGLQPDDMTDALREACTYQGELFAVPLDTHPFLVMFDPEIAEQAGVLNTEGKVSVGSPEEMTEVGAKLAEVTGDHGISFGYMLDTAQSWRLFWGLYQQTSGEWTIEVGSAAHLDIDRAAEVIGAMTNWADGTVMARDQDYGGAVAAFSGGRSGMIFSGNWELVGFLDSKGEGRIDAMAMPTMFGSPATYADAHAYVLPSRPERDPEHDHRIYEFVVGLLELGYQWGQAGHIPGYLPAQSTEEYQQLVPQKNYADVAEQVVFDPPVWFAGAGTSFQNRVSQVLNQAIRGGTEPARAAEAIVAVLDDLLTSPDPTA